MSFKNDVLQYVDQIPSGRVASYGQIAALVGKPAITVGWIMSGLNNQEMEQHPWQRVINKQGFVSTLKLGPKGILHIELLRQEGIEVVEDHVDMNQYRYHFADEEAIEANHSEKLL